MQKRSIALLGSTGSIGRQTLEVAESCHFHMAALAARRNTELLEKQCRKFSPELAVCYDEEAAHDLKIRLADTDIRVAAGMDGLLEACRLESADTVLTAVVGMIGLEPTLEAIHAGKRIALANKETLVCGGELVMAEAGKYGAEIVPVDSEHSAIFQSLQGCRDRSEVERLILTASGGPFFGWTQERLRSVKKEQALKNPNWSMGAKVTIDSATLMNKGLEMIEAMRLYHVAADQIEIVVHRQSILHSAVEFRDGAIIGQLGYPDMRLPIQYALTWPNRTVGPARKLDLFSCRPLTFEKPDEKNFRCLALAKKAAKTGGTACAVLNGANEVAVARFLKDEIGFLDIAEIVEKAMEQVPSGPADTLGKILEADRAARETARLA